MTKRGRTLRKIARSGRPMISTYFAHGEMKEELVSFSVLLKTVYDIGQGLNFKYYPKTNCHTIADLQDQKTKIRKRKHQLEMMRLHGLSEEETAYLLK